MYLFFSQKELFPAFPTFFSYAKWLNSYSKLNQVQAS